MVNTVLVLLFQHRSTHNGAIFAPEQYGTGRTIPFWQFLTPWIVYSA